MVSATISTFSGDASIDPIIAGTHWTWSSGEARQLTYSFATATSQWIAFYGDGEPTAAGFDTLTAAHSAAARLALAAWQAVANVTFVEVSDNAVDPGGVLRFGRGDFADEAAHAYFPSGAPEGGDIWLSVNSFSNVETVPVGGFEFTTLLHEVGHAIGLAHPHGTGVFGTTPIASSADDWMGMTVMSYKDWQGVPLSQASQTYATRYPSTPMLLDIAAIQHLYGANTSYNAGNTTYSWSVGEGILETIWDGGGVDVIDWSNQSSPARINLTPGVWSELGPPYDLYTVNSVTNVSMFDHSESRTLMIAYGVVIENANGGSGDDVIIGNSAGNRLAGNGGWDDLQGRGGNDVLEGGAGNDTLRGGAGRDMVDYSASPGGASVDLSAGTAGDGLGGSDTLIGVEDVLGSGKGDFVKGDAVQNLLLGAAGPDILAGGSSDAGDDDTLLGGAGNDTLWGAGGADTLRGGAGSDELNGGQGADTLDGGAGADVLNGGAGFDFADYGASPSGLLATQKFGVYNTGQAAGDTFSSVEGMLGSAFGDILGGNDEANILRGQGGADKLFGFAGDDTLRGDAGDDKLNGGAGADSLDGGAGFDTASYKLLSSGGVTASLASPGTNSGDAAGDVYTSIEGLEGSNFADSLTGDSAANTLNGAKGDDTLTGGAGDDTFVFGTGRGADVITDFTAGAATEDVIALSLGASFDTFAEIAAAAVQVGADTVIDFGGGDSLTLIGVTPSALHADDFLFV